MMHPIYAPCEKLCLTEPSYGRMKRVQIYENGDPRCYLFNLVPRNFRTWNAVLQHISNIIRPLFGCVKHLLELRTCRLIETFAELDPCEKYIALGANTLLKIPPEGYKCCCEIRCVLEKQLYCGKMDARMLCFLSETKKKGLTVVYVVKNGVCIQKPRKVVLRKRDLCDWDLILKYLAQALDIKEGVAYVCTIFGQMLCEPSEFQHGYVYVAVPYQEDFCLLDYLSTFQNLCCLYRRSYASQIRPCCKRYKCKKYMSCCPCQGCPFKACCSYNHADDWCQGDILGRIECSNCRNEDENDEKSCTCAAAIENGKPDGPEKVNCVIAIENDKKYSKRSKKHKSKDKSARSSSPSCESSESGGSANDVQTAAFAYKTDAGEYCTCNPPKAPSDAICDNTSNHPCKKLSKKKRKSMSKKKRNKDDPQICQQVCIPDYSACSTPPCLQECTPSCLLDCPSPCLSTCQPDCPPECPPECSQDCQPDCPDDCPRCHPLRGFGFRSLCPACRSRCNPTCNAPLQLEGCFYKQMLGQWKSRNPCCKYCPKTPQSCYTRPLCCGFGRERVKPECACTVCSNPSERTDEIDNRHSELSKKLEKLEDSNALNTEVSAKVSEFSDKRSADTEQSYELDRSPSQESIEDVCSCSQNNLKDVEYRTSPIEKNCSEYSRQSTVGSDLDREINEYNERVYDLRDYCGCEATPNAGTVENLSVRISISHTSNKSLKDACSAKSSVQSCRNTMTIAPDKCHKPISNEPSLHCCASSSNTSQKCHHSCSNTENSNKGDSCSQISEQQCASCCGNFGEAGPTMCIHQRYNHDNRCGKLKCKSLYSRKKFKKCGKKVCCLCLPPNAPPPDIRSPKCCPDLDWLKQKALCRRRICNKSCMPVHQLPTLIVDFIAERNCCCCCPGMERKEMIWFWK